MENECVAVSVCLMELIMVSYVLHNETHPRGKPIFSAGLRSGSFFHGALQSSVQEWQWVLVYRLK